MENCVFLPLPSPSSSSSSKPLFRFFSRPILLSAPSSSLCVRRRVRASAGASHCEFSSLNSPLEPRSLVGKFLTGVLQNHPQLFHVAVQEELKLLNDDRDAANARMLLLSGSDEALLHRYNE